MAKQAIVSMDPRRNAYEVWLDRYLIVLSIVMMVFGLNQWAIILGIISGAGGAFEAMNFEWKILTMHMAVVYLVAAVGLWMRVAWGRVLWVYAAVSEIFFHTVFVGKFGLDLPILVFHFVTLLIFVVLTFLAHRFARA